MIFGLLADIVLVLHAAFIAFVVFGGLLVARWPRMAWVHLPAVFWGVVVEVAGWICPLTPLEVVLRRWGGGQGYEGSFIEHYLTAIIYPEGLTRSIQLALGAGALLLNLLIYLWLVRRARNGPSDVRARET